MIFVDFLQFEGSNPPSLSRGLAGQGQGYRAVRQWPSGAQDCLLLLAQGSRGSLGCADPSLPIGQFWRGPSTLRVPLLTEWTEPTPRGVRSGRGRHWNHFMPGFWGQVLGSAWQACVRGNMWKFFCPKPKQAGRRVVSPRPLRRWTTRSGPKIRGQDREPRLRLRSGAKIEE